MRPASEPTLTHSSMLGVQGRPRTEGLPGRGGFGLSFKDQRVGRGRRVFLAAEGDEGPCPPPGWSLRDPAQGLPAGDKRKRQS